MATDGAMTPALRTVRVRTEVAALTKTFDYAVPARWTEDVRVGTRVRVPLHGRTVRGWVVETDVSTLDGVEVLPLKSWLGWGPPADLVEVAEWASWRWAGPVSFFLHAASPPVVVRALPESPALHTAVVSRARGEASHRVWDGALTQPGATVVRLPPATDLIDLVLSVVEDPGVRARGGSVVVLVPSTGWAERLTARLVRRGCPATGTWDEARAGWPVVVGSRAGAWAPVPRLAAAVVLDAHDASYREESAPTYSAVDVLLERARRQAAPCVLVSPVPPVALATHEGIETLAPSPLEERAGWPTLERVDRRGADPRTGMFSEEFVRLARTVLDDPAASERGPLVCVYNRTGGARLLACSHCGELARCTRCGAAASRPRDEEVLRCPRCGDSRPVVCAACGRLRMKTLRAGVSRLREELAALLGVEVGEVAGPRAGGTETAFPAAPVLVGTEAVLHRVRHAAAVAFLDIDLHLLAARLSAIEDTLALFVRAARLVGARVAPVHRGRGCRPRPACPTTRCWRRCGRAGRRRCSPRRRPSGASRLCRRSRRWRSCRACSHPTSPRCWRRRPTSAPVRGAVTVSTLDEGRFLVRAATHAPLCDLLARVPRPAGRGLRVEVDPASL